MVLRMRLVFTGAIFLKRGNTSIFIIVLFWRNVNPTPFKKLASADTMRPVGGAILHALPGSIGAAKDTSCFPRPGISPRSGPLVIAVSLQLIGENAQFQHALLELHKKTEAQAVGPDFRCYVCQVVRRRPLLSSPSAILADPPRRSRLPRSPTPPPSRGTALYCPTGCKYTPR